MLAQSTAVTSVTNGGSITQTCRHVGQYTHKALKGTYTTKVSTKITMYEQNI